MILVDRLVVIVDAGFAGVLVVEVDVGHVRVGGARGTIGPGCGSGSLHMRERRALIPALAG